MLDWEKVLKELINFTEHTPINQLCDMSIDTLYGSMYGLNHRYMTLEQALQKDFHNIHYYSLSRIKRLLKRNITKVQAKNIFSSQQRVGFGTYGWKYNSELIELAIKMGAIIDTAEGYGYGKVEEKLGHIISENEKNKPCIITKVSRNHMSPQAIVAAAERSKRKLGIPFHYQLHFPNPSILDEQICRTLEYLKRKKIILSIGLGNCSVDMIESVQSFLFDFFEDSVNFVQVKYNVEDRRIEKFLLPYCQERNIYIVAYSPLGQNFANIHKPILDDIGELHKCSAAQVALAWILYKQTILPIPRTNNLQHMKDNLNASNIYLNEKDIKRIDKVYEP